MEGFRFSTELAVRFAETDAQGIAHNASYFVWFEVARADLLRSLGWTYREMEHDGVSLPVIEAQLHQRTISLRSAKCYRYDGRRC